MRGMGLVLCELWQYHDDRRIHRHRLSSALSHVVVPDVSLETLAHLTDQIAAARMTVFMPVNSVAAYQSRIVALSGSAFSRQDGA